MFCFPTHLKSPYEDLMFGATALTALTWTGYKIHNLFLRRSIGLVSSHDSPNLPFYLFENKSSYNIWHGNCNI